MTATQTDSPKPPIDRFLNPSNVSIVGAKDGDGGWPDRIYANLRKFGYSGQIFAINPNRSEVWGQRSFPDLKSLPARPDHAVIMIPARGALSTVADAIEAGASSATILSGGFSETQSRELRRIVDDANFVVCGPNCLGVISVPSALVTTTDSRIPRLLDGPVAVMGQSGGIVMALNRALVARGIGARYAISTGNETCVDSADYISYFAEDPHIRAVLGFVESVRDWERFATACTKLRARGKYLVALKIGQATETRSAAASHTGAIAGTYEAFAAVAGRLGVVTVDNVDSAIEACEYLSRVPAPAGPAVGAITISGGVRELLLDAAARARSPFPSLAASTLADLEAITNEPSVGNPVDTGYAGISSVDVLVQSTKTMAADPGVDVVVIQEELLGQEAANKRHTLSVLNRSFPAGVEPGSGKPVALFSISTVNVTDFGRQLRAELPNLAFLQGVDRTLTTIDAVGKANRSWLESCEDRLPESVFERPVAQRRGSAPVIGGDLNEEESRAILADYGFSAPPGGFALDADAAVTIAEEVGYPVVVKLVSRSMVHKSEAGAVLLGIDSAPALRRACEKLCARFPAFEGLLVFRQVDSTRVEILVGFTIDPEVGPVVVIGQGGTEAEALNDTVLLSAPCTRREVTRALEQTRVRTLLGPWRGRPPCDVDAVIEAACAMGRFAAERSTEFRSAEVNPLAVIPGQRGAWMLDSLVQRVGSDADV